MIGARVREEYERRAKKRQKDAGERGKEGGRGHKKTPVENLPQGFSDSGKARDQAGAVVGVSGKSIDHATKVLRQGIPELVKAVDENRIKVSSAAAIERGGFS